MEGRQAGAYWKVSIGLRTYSTNTYITNKPKKSVYLYATYTLEPDEEYTYMHTYTEQKLRNSLVAFQRAKWEIRLSGPPTH